MNPIRDTLVVGGVFEALRGVYDPELGIDVVDLGLVHAVGVDDAVITIEMTLTTPGCPVSEQLPAEARAAVVAAFPDTHVEVRVVWDPPWTPDRMHRDPFELLGDG